MKSWTEKLNAPGRHEVKPAPISIAGMKADEIMLVPTPKIVEAFIRAIPKGESLSVQGLRKAMAQEFGAEVSCPITTGFHLRTVAEAAHEALAQGAAADEITPFWRVLDAKTPTTAKLSFGAGFVAERRAQEGLRG